MPFYVPTGKSYDRELSSKYPLGIENRAGISTQKQNRNDVDLARQHKKEELGWRLIAKQLPAKPGRVSRSEQLQQHAPYVNCQLSTSYFQFKSQPF